jgi:outer membrane lipoprotein-sorting protein
MIKKKTYLILIFIFFLNCTANASIKSNIISNFNNIKNLSFEFKQNINEKTEKGRCIVEYPKKIYCEYDNFHKKILVSNGKHLVIKNQINNQYYIYPIEKTALNLILNKKFLIEKMNIAKGDLIDNKYYRFKFIEGDHQINIFFDKNSFNIIGWQNIDIYQNLVITYLFDLKKNIKIKKNQFTLPDRSE